MKSFPLHSLHLLCWTGLACSALSAIAAPAVPTEKCTNFKSTFAFPNTAIISAQVVRAGTYSPANPGEKTGPVTGLPDFCRVIGVLTPSFDSQIGVEVWLPLNGWNGKFESIGNHNLGGVIYYGDMGQQLKRNYAVSSSDTGHIGNEAKWGVGHPEKVADFGWRAVHLQTVAAKGMVAAFYGTGPRYSYFNGCSMGGREALQEAQRFPDDYDGIISGSAMNNWTRSHLAHIFASQVLLEDGADGAHYISPDKSDLIVNSVLAACRTNDTQAATDGFLRNPTRCNWKPQSLVCKAGQDPGTCITAAQAESLEKLYSPIRNPRTKEEIYPAITVTSALPNAIGLQSGPAAKYLQWIVFNKPEWRSGDLNFDSDVIFTDTSDAEGPQINAIDPNLSGFQKRHGKLISYHGWVDPGFTAEFNVGYYERVVGMIGQSEHAKDEAALKSTQDFYRLFVVPGMGHCTGGPGPNAFGGLAQPAVPADAQHDVFSALELWVEKGAAPTQIVATKYVKDDPKQGIAMQRPVCVYPQEAVYKGQGSTADAANFKCMDESRNLRPSPADHLQPQPIPKR